LQEALGVLENFYIDMYKTTVINKQKSVKKHSSNKDEFSTVKRKQANIWSNNPHSKYDEKTIAEILWLRINGFKGKDIEEMYQHIGIKRNYIMTIGLTRWINLEPIKPEWIKEKDIDTTISTSLTSAPASVLM
jgi:hypothetical protein